MSGEPYRGLLLADTPAQMPVFENVAAPPPATL